MTDQPASFFLIIGDHDQKFFSVEGPMTDDRPWKDGARVARNNGRKITCGPAGPDREPLVVEFTKAHNFAGVPPGTILRAPR